MFIFFKIFFVDDEAPRFPDLHTPLSIQSNTRRHFNVSTTTIVTGVPFWKTVSMPAIDVGCVLAPSRFL